MRRHNGFESVLMTLLLSACASGCTSNPPTQIVADASTAFPASTLVDWVSFADQVSVVTVTADREAAVDVFSDGRALIGREVTIRLDETLWSSGRAAPTREIKLRNLGWFRKDGHKIPMVLRNSPRLEVGGQYVMPLVQVNGYWSALAPDAVLASANSSIAAQDVRAHGQSHLAAQLSGGSIRRLQAVLADTPRSKLDQRAAIVASLDMQ